MEICRGKFAGRTSTRNPKNDHTKAGNPGLRRIWEAGNSRFSQ
jgi:hypothetical protein